MNDSKLLERLENQVNFYDVRIENIKNEIKCETDSINRCIKNGIIIGYEQIIESLNYIINSHKEATSDKVTTTNSI